MSLELGTCDFNTLPHLSFLPGCACFPELSNYDFHITQALHEEAQLYVDFFFPSDSGASSSAGGSGEESPGGGVVLPTQLSGGL